MHEFKFRGILNRARLLRSRVQELGTAGAAIEGHVQDRLRWRPTDELPPGQSELADEIIELLDNPRLSPSQVAQLEHALFGSRYSH